MNGVSILVSSDQTVRRRVADIYSCRVNEDLDARGFALIDNILSPRECRKLASLYPDDVHFRSRVVMAQHGGCRRNLCWNDSGALQRHQLI
jgi:hypothetical protein